MTERIAVIMSVYKNDRLDWFKESIDSIKRQSYSNTILLISQDGFVSNDIADYLECISTENNIIIFKHMRSKGLATRLNEMIDYIQKEMTDIKYIARMDADDISNFDRLEKQFNFFEQHPNIDVCGSSVIEIDEVNNQLSIKKMDVDDVIIKSKIIKRCPFNHPTVMFRERIFSNGIRYDNHLKNTQDYYLWIKLAALEYKFANIDEPLLKFRITNNFYKKRGVKKALNDFKGKLYAIKTLKKYSIESYFYAFAILILRLSPTIVSKFTYKYFR